ncbi:hypothetical protein [Euzebya pacifica]|uniref:hypothetical protein n=1 Tax=Euzebya pacifica TaxID=1608957 RepID=UPI0030F83475
MRRPPIRLFLCLVLVLLLAAPATAADDYTDPEYRTHEADNLTRGRGMQLYQLTTPAYHRAFVAASADSLARAQGHQLADATHGRAYVGASQYMSTWGVGNAEDYFDVTPREIAFVSQTGAKLYGHIWGSELPGPRPGVVITTGSIQGSNQMYWWAARALTAAGYVVMTYDVQGQGQSETFGHEPGSIAPTTEGVPFQQSFNFVQGTIDAMRFFLSTPDDPYVPATWTADDVVSQQASSDGERMDWVNPAWAVLDGANIGIAGHSLGASAVTVVQQCSDESDRYLEVPDCHGESYPIRAVVGWDQLGTTDYEPVVPGMNQAADGYFLSPTPSPTAPDPDETLAAHTAWTAAGIDTYTVVVRAGTHLEWSQVAYHGPATRYGEALAAYYTVAWMDRWVPDDPTRNAVAYRALVEGPRPDDEAAPSSAAYMSVRRRGAFSLTDPTALAQDPDTAQAMEVVDLRDWAGRSAVGDWAGANADTVGAVLPD